MKIVKVSRLQSAATENLRKLISDDVEAYAEDLQIPFEYQFFIAQLRVKKNN